jgi:NADH dehydrogenase
MAGELNGPHRVIVVGGGFAGLLATRVLACARVDITLIDRSTAASGRGLVTETCGEALPHLPVAQRC